MARNTTLANALLMLKAEVGITLTAGVGTAKDDELYTLIDNKQKWLAAEFDWPFLKQRADVSITAGTGDASRYPTLPTTIDFERPVTVETLWTTKWLPVTFGINSENYNCYSSGDGSVTAVQQDPIQRWDWKAGDETKIEVWPLPATAQTLRFTGQRYLTDLKNGGSTYVTSQTLDLDDLMVVLFVAADLLASMKKEDAKLKLSTAEARMRKIRGAYPTPSRPVVLGNAYHRPPRRVVPLVTTA